MHIGCFMSASVVTVADNIQKIISGQRPKRFRRSQVLTTLNLINKEDPAGSKAETKRMLLTGSYQFWKKS